jgi:hypothetical protein
VTKSEKVTNFIVTKTDRDFTDLTVATPDGAKAVTSTQHHPYWNESRREWQNAADLRSGDTLREPDGSALRVLAVRNYHALVDTYNLTVDHLHTYYVPAGAAPVLVHNTGGGLCDISEVKGDEPGTAARLMASSEYKGGKLLGFSDTR